MSPLALMAVLLLSAEGQVPAADPSKEGRAGAEAGPCYLPADQTPGWKLVALPPSAPALAAPEGVEQFRSDEPVWLADADLRHYEGASDVRAGKRTFELALPPGTRRVELEFRQPLRGAKVDVEGLFGVRSYPLVTERRVPGPVLDV
jgi:hypothetical protein